MKWNVPLPLAGAESPITMTPNPGPLFIDAEMPKQTL
jgi:hypothetical protein